MATLKAYPNGVDESISVYASADSSYPASNVFGKDENNTTFARWYMTTGMAKATKIVFTFDVSAIPRDATIDNVSVAAKARLQNSSMSYGGNSNLTLQDGDENVARTDNLTLYGTDPSVETLSSTDFTRAMLDNIRVGFNSSRGLLGTNNQYYVDFYGCTLTIEYTTANNNNKFMLKTNGVWTECTEIYKKVNGAWVLQTDITSIFEDGINYK